MWELWVNWLHSVKHKHTLWLVTTSHVKSALLSHDLWQMLRKFKTSTTALDMAPPQHCMLTFKPTSRHILVTFTNIPSLAPVSWRHSSLSPGVLIIFNPKPMLPATIWRRASHTDNVRSSVLASGLLLIRVSYITIMASIDDSRLDLVRTGHLTFGWHPDRKRTGCEVCVWKLKALPKVHVHTLNSIEVWLFALLHIWTLER